LADVIRKLNAEASYFVAQDGLRCALIFLELNAEASYFVAQDGLRCALIFFDMKDGAEPAAIAEPLFMGLSAEIEVVPG
jgi:hypothetical protein